MQTADSIREIRLPKIVAIFNRKNKVQEVSEEC